MEVGKDASGEEMVTERVWVRQGLLCWMEKQGDESEEGTEEQRVWVRRAGLVG